jgi:hypothetical protein
MLSHPHNVGTARFLRVCLLYQSSSFSKSNRKNERICTFYLPEDKGQSYYTGLSLIPFQRMKEAVLTKWPISAIAPIHFFNMGDNWSFFMSML